jgi:hypothetical protein
VRAGSPAPRCGEFLQGTAPPPASGHYCKGLAPCGWVRSPGVLLSHGLRPQLRPVPKAPRALYLHMNSFVPLGNPQRVRDAFVSPHFTEQKTEALPKVTHRAVE